MLQIAWGLPWSISSIPAALLLGNDFMASLISATLGAFSLIRGLLLYRSGSADSGGAFSAKLWLSTEEKLDLHQLAVPHPN